MLLRLHKKKKKKERAAWTAKHPEMFVGSFCSLCPICGLREGVVFSGPLPEGWASVGQVGWLLCLQDKKKEKKNGKEGGGERGLERPFSALLLFQFIGPPYTHPHTGTHTHTRSPLDKVRM